MTEASFSPFITVAIPTHGGRAALLYEAIESCLKQGFQDYELLVSDSSLTDDIEHIVSSFDSPKISYTRYPRHDSTLPQKLNDFLKKGRAKWMVVLGDDDRFEPGYLSTMAQTVREHPDAALVRTRYNFIDTKGLFIKMAPDEPRRVDSADFLNIIFLPWYKRMVNISGVLFPRQKLEELGGFLETPYGWNADTAAWSWLGAQGSCYFESRPLICLRLNESSDYKAKKFDYPSYLQTKRLFFEKITALFEDALKTPDGSSRQKITRAYRHFLKYWMREEARLYLEDDFVSCLNHDKKLAREELKNLAQTIKASGLPVYSPLFAFYEGVSWLPVSVQKVPLWLFNTARRLRRKIFPPERWTFFRKEKPQGAKQFIFLGLVFIAALSALLAYSNHALSFKFLRRRVNHPSITRLKTSSHSSARKWTYLLPTAR